jgi:hypothetical protein
VTFLLKQLDMVRPRLVLRLEALASEQSEFCGVTIPRWVQCSVTLLF